jgi:hypothetical protein
MKVRYLSERALNTLKSSLDAYLPYFAEEMNASLIAKLKEDLETDEIFRDTNYVFPDEELSSSKESDAELGSIKAVYGAMKDLPSAVAMDERLWAGIAIDLGWKYVRERWDIQAMFAQKDKSLKNKIHEHFFFMHNPRRSFTRNAISRLWWLGSLTYDEKNLEDPYRRTRVVTADLGYVVDLLERNFSNNRRISSEFVDAVEAAREKVKAEGKVILRPELRILCKYLNMLGGVYILDSMPEGKIYQKIYDKALEIARQKGSTAPQIEAEEALDEES